MGLTDPAQLRGQMSGQSTPPMPTDMPMPTMQPSAMPMSTMQPTDMPMPTMQPPAMPMPTGMPGGGGGGMP